MPEASATVESAPSTTAILTGTAPAPSGGSGAPGASAAPSAKATKTPAAPKADPAPKAAKASKAAAAPKAPAAPAPEADDEPIASTEATDEAPDLTEEAETPGATDGNDAGEATPEADLSGLSAAIDKLAKNGVKLKTVERLLNSDPAKLIELAADYEDEDAPAVGDAEPGDASPKAPPQPAPEIDAAVNGLVETLGLSEAEAPKVRAFADSITAPVQKQVREIVTQARAQFAQLGGLIESMMTEASIARLSEQFPQMKTPAGLAKVQLKMRAMKEDKSARYPSMDEFVRTAAVHVFAGDIAKQAAETTRHQANNRAKGQMGARGAAASQQATPRTAEEIADWNSRAIDRGMDPAQRRQMLNRFNDAVRAAAR